MLLSLPCLQTYLLLDVLLNTSHTPARITATLDYLNEKTCLSAS